MWRRWQGQYHQWLVSGGYLLCLAVGVQLESVRGWWWALGVTALLALLAWQAALWRSRAVADMPTSNIASAAQGYVELHGRGLPLDGLPLLSPLNHLPCLWYRYKVEKRNGNDWVTESSGESDASFVIDDGSGQCAVDPLGAEVLPQRRETWQQGEHRYTQSLLLAGEMVYVLGHFQTHGGEALNLDIHQDVGHLLTEWKENMPALLKRFDRNGNGELDLEEWEEVRAEARREVELHHQALREMPASHAMSAPQDGRLFLISSLDPARIERRFRWWAVFHMLVFLGALVAAGANAF